MFYDYHFKVEQEAGSATFAFFSFNGTHLLKPLKSTNSQKEGGTTPECLFQNHKNLPNGMSILGTAGVWRTVAIRDAGGWKDRTTVEDMDLAVRATLKGWKFVYVGDIRVSRF